MEQPKELTPEQQLLKLIEEKEDKGAAKAPIKSSLNVAVAKRHTQSLFSLDAFKGRFAFFKSKVKDGGFKSKGAYEVNLKLANAGLRLCVGMLMAYLMFNIPYSIMHSKDALNFELKVNLAARSAGSQLSSLLKANSYYLEKARARNIFKIRMTKGDEKVGKTPFSTIAEATKDLKLVGISWSDDPDIMIEDGKTKSTLFLKKGQLIDNTIKIEAVYKDRVILSYLGEEIELK